MSPKLLSVDEAAEVLSIHRQTVLELIWAGELAWINLNPKGIRPRIRLETAELDRFIKRNKQPAKSAA